LAQWGVPTRFSSCADWRAQMSMNLRHKP
jgi:hypothetical protein